jgi:hypothetical protein
MRLAINLTQSKSKTKHMRLTLQLCYNTESIARTIGNQIPRWVKCSEFERVTNDMSIEIFASSLEIEVGDVYGCGDLL